MVITDEDGDVVRTYEYDSYGEIRETSGYYKDNMRFTGHYWDEETGFYYCRARYYDPEVGRFVTTDPFPGYLEIPATQHPYAYCGDNLANYVDPTGLSWEPYWTESGRLIGYWWCPEETVLPQMPSYYYGDYDYGDLFGNFDAEFGSPGEYWARRLALNRGINPINLRGLQPPPEKIQAKKGSEPSSQDHIPPSWRSFEASSYAQIFSQSTGQNYEDWLRNFRETEEERKEFWSNFTWKTLDALGKTIKPTSFSAYRDSLGRWFIGGIYIDSTHRVHTWP